MDTVRDLIDYFNTEYGISKPWPETFEVSPSLYGECCQFVFEWEAEHKGGVGLPEDRYHHYFIALGAKNKGLMFKGVELILKK